MVDLREGRLLADDASKLTKLAAQVNESMYAEIKISRVQHEMALPIVTFGSMKIGDPE